MIKSARPILAASVVSACVVLLSACGGGGSGSSTHKSSTITASANIPGTAYANSTFKVSVSLTATSPAKSTGSVQVVDTGTVTPQIDCGQPKSLTINATSPTDFSCTAPQAILGGSSTHQLQVEVNGTANLPKPVSVNVINGGRVDVQLTSASGTTITAAAPGQTIDVAFSTTTTPVGTGQYTVTAPSGWQVGNSGKCSIDSQNTSCKVPVTVASGASNGPYSMAIGAELGSSTLSRGVLSISVQSQPPSNDMAFYLSQNISDTLYANSAGSSQTFTYQPVFLFKNTSGSTLSISSPSVSGFKSGTVTYGCVAQPSANGNYTLASTSCSLAPYSATNDGPLYAVSGVLDNSNFSALPAASAISISVKGNGKTYVQHDKQVVFVAYKSGLVAVRVANENPQKEVHIAASFQAPGATAVNMVQFPSSSPYVGTKASVTGANYSGDQLALPGTTSPSPTKATSVFYLPYGNAGEIYLTRGAGGFNSAPAPNPTGSPLPPSFLQIELTYQTNETLTIDQTYVNFISVLGSFNIMGGLGGSSNLLTQSVTRGVITDLPESDLYSSIKNTFDSFGAPWKYDSTNGQKNFIQEDSNGDVTEILAPVQVFQVSSFNPMASNYYDSYVNALWTYLENPSNALYVDASSVGGAGCVAVGRVSTSGANAGELVFTPKVGATCNNYAVAASNSGYVNNCGYTSNDQPANKACEDTLGFSGVQSDVVFDKFNLCDFLSAAAGGYCHKVPDPTTGSTTPVAVNPHTFFDNRNAWGPNGTYRSVIGEAIVAYQAIGLLPDCNNPTQAMNSANASAAIANGEGFTNPSCLSGVTGATFNVYVKALKPYVNVYTYTYSDFLGQSGTVTFAPNPNFSVAQPVTITLR